MAVETCLLLRSMKRIYSRCGYLIGPAREEKQNATKPELSIYDAIRPGTMETWARTRTTYVVD